MSKIEKTINKLNEEEIRNIIKDKGMEFLQKKLEPTSKNYLKEQIEGVLKEAYNKGAILSDYDIKIKRTKLPRKLKKKYKKEQRICFDFEYIEYKQPQWIEFTIPPEENEVKNERKTNKGVIK